MNKKRTLGIIATVAVVLTITIQCKRELSDENEHKNGVHYSSINIQQKQYKYKNLNYKHSRQSNQLNKSSVCNINYDFLTASFDTTNLNNLLLDLKSYFNGDIDNISNNPLKIILYTDADLENINFSNLQGISVVSSNSNNDAYSHKFYQIDGTNTTLLSNLSKDYTFVLLSDFSNLCYLNCTNSTGWALFYTENNLNISSSYNNLGKYLIDELTCLAPKPPSDGGQTACMRDGCGPNDGICGFHNGGELYCDVGVCNLSYINNYGVINNIINSGQELDLNFAYDFRDNFLMNYNKGQEYIQYYYKLGQVLYTFQNLSINNFMTHYEVALKIYNIADILINGNDNDIVVDNTTKNEILSLIDEYKNISSNSEYLEILGQIESDLNYYSGMTKIQILNAIN